MIHQLIGKQKKGDIMPQYRSDRHKKKRKKLKHQRSFGGAALILLVVAAGLSIVGWKVYNDVTSTTNNMHAEVEIDEKRTQTVDVKSGQEPFSVLLMGIDNGDTGQMDKGRSDTMMVMTVNPTMNETSIVSIPRDTYTELAGHGTMDKINHAYAFGGPSMSINTVQNLFDIPIDYYVNVNMRGLRDIIDAIGGVQVTPNFSFTKSGYIFTEGVPLTLDGDGALAYSRMRKQDPRGDYGRQERQRQVIEAAVKKTASFSSIMNYQSILGSFEDNMSTNLTFSEMLDIFNHYRSATRNINQVQLSGYGEYIDGIYYEVIPDEETDRVSNLLKEQLEI